MKMLISEKNRRTLWPGEFGSLASMRVFGRYTLVFCAFWLAYFGGLEQSAKTRFRTSSPSEDFLIESIFTRARAQSSRAQSSNDGQSEGENNGASRPGWVGQFDSVKTETIKPTDLAPTSKPGAPTGLKTTGGKLPRPASEQALREQAKNFSPNVLRIVAVVTPPRPYRQEPMLYFGHAVWVARPDPAAHDSDANTDTNKANKTDASGPNTNDFGSKTEKSPQKPASALLSSYDWLESADKIFALPDALEVDEKMARAVRGTTPARHMSVADLSGQKSAQAWLKKNRDALTELTPHRPDRHRNLVELRADAKQSNQSKKLLPPASGARLFDSTGRVLYALYGFSPYAGDFLKPVKIEPDTPKNPALSFYWQTDYSAILGAPLLSAEGELVALNTIRHPEDDSLFLSIPTLAIATYLGFDPEELGAESKNTGAADASSAPTQPKNAD